jgi:hypothetical protein
VASRAALLFRSAASVVALCSCELDERTLARPSDDIEAPAIYARAATVIGSCLGGAGVNQSLARLWYALESPQLDSRFATRAKCLATAGGGCNAAAECLGWEVGEATEFCAGTCQENRFSGCLAGRQISVRCAELGWRCDETSICVSRPPQVCGDEEKLPACDERGLPLTCDAARIAYGPDCPALGLECSAGTCAGLEGECQSPAADLEGRVRYHGMVCIGASLSACVGNRLHQLDCSSIAAPFKCQGVAGSVFCGSGSECLPAELPGQDEAGERISCDGSSLVVCNAGRRELVDCTELGFAECDAELGRCR